MPQQLGQLPSQPKQCKPKNKYHTFTTFPKTFLFLYSIIRKNPENVKIVFVLEMKYNIIKKKS
jgi:hypothetical protein